MAEKIIILDFGSQVTQLIGRRLRELNVYCEIYPFNKVPALDSSVKGVILSGSPCSVRDKNAPQIDLGGIKGRFPLLGICYGAQYLAHKFGGEVLGSLAREYGRAMLDVVDPESPLLKGVSAHSQVWMSHGDTIARLPEGAEVIASTESVTNAAFHIKGEQTYAVQFHPEVFHTTEGTKILGNFALGICGCKGDWTPASFIETTVASLREQIGDEKVILGLSGGVDSTVAGVLLNKAIGHNLTCIFVNNGLRKTAHIVVGLDLGGDAHPRVEASNLYDAIWVSANCGDEAARRLMASMKNATPLRSSSTRCATNKMMRPSAGRPIFRRASRRSAGA